MGMKRTNPCDYIIRKTDGEWVVLLCVWMGRALADGSVNGYSPLQLRYPSPPSGIRSRSRENLRRRARPRLLTLVVRPASRVPRCRIRHSGRACAEVLLQARRRANHPRHLGSHCGAGKARGQGFYVDSHCRGASGRAPAPVQSRRWPRRPSPRPRAGREEEAIIFLQGQEEEE